MKLSFDFPDLHQLVRRMDARHSTWRSGVIGLSPLEKLQAELLPGKEIPLDQVISQHGGLLTYEDEQIILYIKDTRKSRYILMNEPENAPKFHISECSTIKEMRRSGRFERYVVTNNTNGRFLVEAYDQYTRTVEELTVELHVCKNCLQQLDWKNYTKKSIMEKNAIRDNFSLEDFFFEYSTFFRSKPRYTDKTAPKGGYAKNWSKISDQYRQRNKWICDQCNVDLSEYRSLLHCHHKNGVISDNSLSNIAVLCLLCHSEQPFHNYLKPKLKHRHLIERLRRRQHQHIR